MPPALFTVIASNHVYGIPETTKPLKDFPPGKIRLRFRHEDLGVAHVRTPDGIRCFLIEEKDGHWIPSMELARNLTVQAT